MALILIKKLGSRKEKTGKSSSNWGLYRCSFDDKEVEKRISDAKIIQSCGCQTFKLLSKANLGKKRTEKQRQNIGKASKGRNKGKQIHTEESKQKIRLANKGRKASEETKQKIKENHADFNGKNNPNYGNGDKIRGESNPNWQGGITFEDYGIDFNTDLKQQILERDNFVCQNPFCLGECNKLQIHHIDYNKKNNNSENLTALCISCHMKTNGKKKRNYYTEFYQNLMINRIMECLL